MKDYQDQEPDWIHEEGNNSQPLTDAGKRWITIAMFISVPFCMWAGWFEWGRAHQGNWRAWVYTFEWPFFGALVIYLWRRLTKSGLPQIPRPDFDQLADEFDAKKKEEDQ